MSEVVGELDKRVQDYIAKGQEKRIEDERNALKGDWGCYKERLSLGADWVFRKENEGVKEKLKQDKKVLKDIEKQESQLQTGVWESEREYDEKFKKVKDAYQRSKEVNRKLLQERDAQKVENEQVEKSHNGYEERLRILDLRQRERVVSQPTYRFDRFDNLDAEDVLKMVSCPKLRDETKSKVNDIIKSGGVVWSSTNPYPVLEKYKNMSREKMISELRNDMDKADKTKKKLDSKPGKGFNQDVKKRTNIGPIFEDCIAEKGSQSYTPKADCFSDKGKGVLQQSLSMQNIHQGKKPVTYQVQPNRQYQMYSAR